MKPIDLSWTAKPPEGTGAGSRLATIIAEAAQYQMQAGALLSEAKLMRAAAVKAARRAERMIAPSSSSWSAERVRRNVEE
jgi:hypothetical protein